METALISSVWHSSHLYTSYFEFPDCKIPFLCILSLHFLHMTSMEKPAFRQFKYFLNLKKTSRISKSLITHESAAFHVFNLNPVSDVNSVPFREISIGFQHIQDSAGRIVSGAGVAFTRHCIFYVYNFIV